MEDNRICKKTGLVLTAGPVSAFRIARESLGPFDPPVREGDDVGAWSRYDTLGRTIYASSDKLTAYMEVLAYYRTVAMEQKRALQPAADAMGVPLCDYWKQIVEEWDALGTMKASWLPTAFREGRELYTISFPEGWWVDITKMETIAALNKLAEEIDGLPEELTLGHLTGNDREITTAIATLLRTKIELDDGTVPLGIEFGTKHGQPAGGGGTCWAYWMRQLDVGFDEPAVCTNSESIELDDSAYKSALAYCKIKSR
ncbi:hypothetical protein [Homoserinimonas hongtaonis]|uniref:RES domain-containing protein n=1 Tax=Homoserinimonas hongtaonis TaxID=2079791 RepID=A0A2U1T110_9MICO|nr:hypothetical protein [Salinibacterium hongtaonis]PWB97547.1 hypothetical protein DF220_06680 [Salinibacterium hongtaonis]